MYSNSSAVYIEKRYLVSFHTRLNTNSVILFKNGRNSLQILLKITKDSRKISFPSSFKTAPEKKPNKKKNPEKQLVLPRATSAVIHKN